MKQRMSLLLVLAIAIAASLMAQNDAKSPRHIAKAKDASPFVGTWKMDVADSKLHQPLKTETVIITAADDQRIAYHGTMTDDKGKAMTFRYSGQLGKDAPSYMDGKASGKESWKMADANTMSTEQEGQDGSKTAGDCKLTDDAKTMTCNWHTAPKTGDGWDEVYVMHRG